MVSVALIAIFYSLLAANVPLREDLILILSKGTFAVSLAVYYLATVLVKVEAPDLSNALSSTAKSLSDQLTQRQQDRDNH
jgi:hypothetical protein